LNETEAIRPEVLSFARDWINQALPIQIYTFTKFTMNSAYPPNGMYP